MIIQRSVIVIVAQVDFSGKPAFWKALKPPAKDKCGDLLISLCYHPSNSILTLTLIKARNLKAKDINGKSGKVVLVPRILFKFFDLFFETFVLGLIFSETILDIKQFL